MVSSSRWGFSSTWRSFFNILWRTSLCWSIEPVSMDERKREGSGSPSFIMVWCALSCVRTVPENGRRTDRECGNSKWEIVCLSTSYSAHLAHHTTMLVSSSSCCAGYLYHHSKMEQPVLDEAMVVSSLCALRHSTIHTFTPKCNTEVARMKALTVPVLCNWCKVTTLTTPAKFDGILLEIWAGASNTTSSSRHGTLQKQLPVVALQYSWYCYTFSTTGR